MKRLAVGLVILLLIAGAGFVFYLYPSSRATAAGSEQPVAGTGPARILLNEILFAPGPNQSASIELVNAGGAAGTLDGLVLESQDGGKFPLPERVTLRAGDVIVVPAAGLSARGAIRLIGPQGALDRIAWGEGQTGAANLSRGGFDDGLPPGSTIGRVPGSAATDPLEWVSYAPAQSTLGAVNQQPGVEVMMPMDGAIVSAATVDLAWYTVPATARYRLQIATDPSFASPLLDRTVEAPPVTTPALAAGSYLWRVQAIGVTGSAAGYSMPNALIVRAPRPRAVRNESPIERLFPVLHAAARQPESTDSELPTVLDVPLIHQHKDTRMLLLESRREVAGTFGHSWDDDHGELALWDPADNMNCAPASLAMLVQYYKQRFNYPGRLSQDRINYEMFHAESAGPEGDLSWGRSYNRERLTKAMAFAFGVPPSIDPPAYDRLWTQSIWEARIHAGMPGILCKNGHCVAIVGAGGEPSMLVINDPGSRGTYLAPMRVLQSATVFVMARPNDGNESLDPILVRPRSDEAGITTDSDGDGVVDFDEINRFKTNPKSTDTDQDELPDKQDISASVHDRSHGFAFGGTGRDFDGDGKAMELDADADGGGCLDGWEDQNKNGKFEPALREFSNFEKTDDDCVSGTYEFVNDTLVSYGAKTEKVVTRTFLQVSLRAVGGEQRGVGILTHTYRRDEDGPFGSCESDFIQVGDPYQYVVPMRGTITPLTDGSVAVDVRPAPEWIPPAVQHRFINCSEIPPFEVAMATFGLAGNARNGVLNARENLPLSDGHTGTNYAETHIRIGRGRR